MPQYQYDAESNRVNIVNHDFQDNVQALNDIKKMDDRKYRLYFKCPNFIPIDIQDAYSLVKIYEKGDFEVDQTKIYRSKITTISSTQIVIDVESDDDLTAIDTDSHIFHLELVFQSEIALQNFRQQQ